MWLNMSESEGMKNTNLQNVAKLLENVSVCMSTVVSPVYDPTLNSWHTSCINSCVRGCELFILMAPQGLGF